MRIRRAKVAVRKEQRRAPRERKNENRVTEENKVSVEILSGENPFAQLPPINALTKDISPGGVKLMSSIRLEPGTRVRLEIVLSGRRRLIRVPGIVRWSRSVYEEDLFEMGVEFSRLRPEDSVSLLEHVYKRRD